MSAETVDILRRLSEIRRTIRRRLGLYGVFAVASGGCLSFLTVIAIDWLLELPAALRVFGAVLFLIGFGAASLHWIVRPLQVRLSLVQVAGKLEQRFPWLNDRLASTVWFLTKSGGSRDDSETSGPLMREVILSTNRAVESLPLETILTWRPVTFQAGLLAVGLIVLAGVSATSHEWVMTGLMRYAQPLNAPDWPHSVQIEPVTNQLKVPLGESTTVRMGVTRGNHPDLRGVVHLVDASGEHTVLAMLRNADGDYGCTIDAVTTDLTYWFEAGDDDTRRRASGITAVRRPAVSAITAHVEPPAYATAGLETANVVNGRQSSHGVEFDLTTGSASAVPGSVAVITVTSSKPIRATDDAGTVAAAWLELRSEHRDGERIALSFVGDDPRVVSGRLDVTEGEAFEVFVEDRDGLNNRSGPAYRIATRPDRPPSVEVAEPRAVVEMTPRGSIRIRARVEEDWGLSELRLTSRASGGSDETVVPLFGLAEVSSSPGSVTASIDYEWNLSSMKLKPPTTVMYRIEAVDNCPHGPTVGQVGASSTMKLKIIGDREFEKHVNDEFAILQKSVRHALQAQQKASDSAESIRASAGSGRLGRSEREGLAEAAHRQAEATSRLRGLAQRFDELSDRMRANPVHDGESTALIDGARESLSRAAEGPAAQAAHMLDESGSAEEWSAAGPLLSDAIESGQAVSASLVELIRLLDGWGDFQALLRKTRDLADREQVMQEEGARIRNETMGRRVEELTKAQQSELEQLERKQRQIGEEFAGLVDRMTQRSKSGIDAATAAAIQAALRAAGASEVSQHMLQAAKAIAENRLAASDIDQRAAVRGLGKMAAGLEERESRRLAELAKRLEQADRAVAELLARQVGLRTATQEAAAIDAARDVFEPLSRAQDQLQRNAGAFGEELSETPETAEAGDFVRQAARIMTDAATALTAGDGESATDPQSSAVELLHRALRILEERAQAAAHAASQRMLAAVRAELEEVRDLQRGINEGTRESAEGKASSGRINREGARRLSALTGDQKKLIETTDAVRAKMARAVVYDLVLGRIADEMKVSREALDQRRLDDALSSTQTRIVRRLDELIDALQEAASLPPSDEFVETGGGGNGDEAGERAAIPTAAELLVLKSMQKEVLNETMELDASRIKGDEASEKDMRAASSLGERQREIRELTQAVVKKAAGRE